MSSKSDPSSTDQRKPRAPYELPLEDERLAHLVRDARRGLVKALQNALAKHDVAFGHWTFLRILWVRDDVNQRKLSGLAGVMEPTTFAALQAMERLGYIERRRRPGNKKNIYVYLTAQGRALREKLEPIAVGINERSIEGISDADIASTRRTLLAMIDNLARENAEPPIVSRPAPVSALATSPSRKAASAR
jgi:DNA-binding MarR family transcriptional regulator